MSKSIALACLSLAACASNVEPEPQSIAKEEVVEYELGPARLEPELDDNGKSIPGTLTIDTSRGNVDITHLVPEKPREFGSREDFHAWIQKELGATRVESEAGIGSSLAYSVGTTALLDPDTNEYELVEDAVEMIIGGRDGHVIVGGEKLCVSRRLCPEELGFEKPDTRAPVSNNRRANGPAGLMGIEGTSWHSPPVPYRPFFTIVAAMTTQWNAPGGATIIYTSCSSGTGVCKFVFGSNLMRARYTPRRGTAPMPAKFRTLTLANEAFVTVADTYYDVYPWGQSTDNVCASHAGSASGDVVTLTTGSLAGLWFNDCP